MSRSLEKASRAAAWEAFFDCGTGGPGRFAGFLGMECFFFWRMRIVFTIKSINLGGGSERSTATVANALAGRGHEVSIVSYTGRGGEPFFDIDPRISRYYLSPGRDRWPVLLRECRRIVLLRRLYARLRPDVIVVIGTTRAFVNVPATRGYRVVAKEYFSIDHRSQLTSSLSRRLTARHAQAIVALSEYDARVYRQRYGTKKAVVIPNPLTFAAPQPSPLQDKVVLGLGRMSYVKGFDLLLDAWSRVAHKDWELHLVGDGKMKKKLERMVRDRGIGGVRFFPATSDVEPHYRSASIFVLPSRSEAFGNVLLEAMSVGLPVVSFDCGAGPRDIILPGQTGVFVPPGDTESMAGELDRLMADPGRLRRMGNAARESIRRYDRGLIVSQWEDLLIKTSRE